MKFGPIDEGSPGESCVYILNLNSKKWGALVAPRDTTRQMDTPIEIAKNEVTRAKNRLQAERDKGFMLGTLTVYRIPHMDSTFNVCARCEGRAYH